MQEPVEMNAITKAIKHQEKTAKKTLSNFDTITKLIATPQYIPQIQEHQGRFRNRLYNPVQTLSMFIAQALSPDSSCQKVVNQGALFDPGRSISTGGYCKARKRLDTAMVKRLCLNIAMNNERQVDHSWKWHERSVYLVDGTTLLMTDTPANQEHYPQTSALAQGLGFPICRMLGIVSLYSGSLINAAISPYHGKGASEQTLLRSMLSTFKTGDVVLADAFYSTYFLIAHMIEHNIDIVFMQNGARSRTTNFDTGLQLGRGDHLIDIVKPKQKPDWMSQKAYDAAADKLTIRELKAAGKILITTMLCPKKHPKRSLGNLYKQRWNIELDLRNIKTTMGLEMLSCKTPDMAIKELWVYFLAYNLIRSLMISSALYARVLPRMLSFKHTLQLLLSYYFPVLYEEEFLMLIAKKQIGNRKGRIEPRVIKRRHRNDYRLMMKPRHVLREEVKRNGHPKKVK